MKVGDLVTGKGFLWSRYGVGIIIGKEFGGFKVYWPTQGSWCLTSEGGIELL